ncbi:Proline--tRNA ligase (fragment) [Methylocella tundrae]
MFFFGDKYSKPMHAMITGPDGVERPFQGGAYGVGVSRLVGALIEANHDEAGIIWPASVAPFKVGLANLKAGDDAVDAACAKIYEALETAGVDVLYDDSDERPGAKFAKLDLIGLPYQLIVGPKGLAEGKVEVKTRATGARESLSVDEAISRLTLA